ncbi:MAG: hypothetical protein HY904_05310, partial [Deltaproteobacteria bacterium]|nr:hypothetical protein [Deltaproteobacteria bacterium]
PGELVRVQGGRAETLGMVAPPMPPQHRTHQGALNAVESEVQEVLKDSIRAHLVSDVEVGTLLSGGIDSAVVTALAVEVHGGPVRAFTLAVDDPALDETELATHAARTLGVRHHVLRVGPDQARARLPALLGSLDEPLADPSILPTRLVAELAREHVKVVLSGDGGDELFLGYTRHRFMDALDRARTLGPLSTWAARAGAHLPARALDAAYGSLHGVLGLPDVVAPARKLAAAAESLREDRVLAYGRLFRAGTPAELTRLGLPHDPAIPVLRAAGEGYDGADAAGLGQAVDVRLWLPDDILAKVDRASMAVGLEARVPLIDVEVARVAASLPGYALRSGSTGKVVLRRLAEKRFGPGLARADKRGFGLPMRDWLAGPLRPWRTEALASLSDRGLFDGHGLRALQEAHDTGTDHAPILFALCALEMWLRARASVVA